MHIHFNNKLLFSKAHNLLNRKKKTSRQTDRQTNKGTGWGVQYANFILCPFYAMHVRDRIIVRRIIRIVHKPDTYINYRQNCTQTKTNSYKKNELLMYYSVNNTTKRCRFRNVNVLTQMHPNLTTQMHSTTHKCWQWWQITLRYRQRMHNAHPNISNMSTMQQHAQKHGIT